ncbi:MAG: YfhO family protein [Lachnospiraceae bacterium]|nr:YfhO family protein [Lachnospiraceae bacterium]
MEATKRKQCGEYVKFYLLYTAVFVCTAALVFTAFMKGGKSFIWRPDGLKQHYLSLAYYGEYLREIIHNLFVEHKFLIPMWDMNIGYGADILLTLHYYVLGDPLNLLSVFVPAEKTEYLYEALILLRIYLSGIAFSAYAFSHKKNKSGTLIGMLLYCFSGYVLYAGVKHPYFTNPMIYLPFLLIGIDRIFKKKRPYLFIAAVTVSAVSNFYFFYMLCIFMFLYAVFRYFMTEKGFRISAMLMWLGKFIGFFAIGIMLAAPIFLPIVLKMLGAQRLGVDNEIPILFSALYYEKAWFGFAGYVSPSSWNVMGYTPIALFSVFVLWLKKKKHTELKLGFLLLSVFICIPYIGHVFNGFSYVTVRWIWGYSMLVAYIVTCTFPYISSLGKKEKLWITAGMLLWMVISALIVIVGLEKYWLPAMGIFVLSVCLMGWCFFPVRKSMIFRLGVLGIAVGGIFLNSITCYYNYVKQFVDSGSGWTTITEVPDNAIQEEDNEFYRYDQYEATDITNAAMIQKKCTPQFYFSMSDNNISSFMREMYLNFSSDYNYNNLDGRSVLEALAAVRYFVIQEDGQGYLPYAYTKQNGDVVLDGMRYIAYEDENALPMGVTFEHYLSRQEYEKLDVLKKQEALLQAVVVEEAEIDWCSPEFTCEEVPYTVTLGEGVIQTEENTFKVSKKNAEIVLNFQGKGESETYLILEGLHYEGKGTLFNICVTGEGVAKNIRYRTESERSYCGMHDFLCNLGFRKEAQNEVRLTFPEKGIYTMEQLRVACQPVVPLASYSSKLKEKTLEQITFGTNSMKGKIRLAEPKILFLSIPYSKGFKAYVDGEEWEIKQADTMYMALELEAGEHQVELTYTTPYLKLGILVMILGIFSVAVLIVWERKRKKKEAA